MKRIHVHSVPRDLKKRTLIQWMGGSGVQWPLKPPMWVKGTLEVQGSSGDFKETWHYYNFRFHITADFQKMPLAFILVWYPKGRPQLEEADVKTVLLYAARCLSGPTGGGTHAVLFPVVSMMGEQMSTVKQ